MTLTKLFIYIAIFAIILLVGAIVSDKSKNAIVSWVQFFVGGLFVFSGVIKAVDPVGTAIKMEEYFEVFVEYTPALEGFWHFFAHHALAVSIIFIVLEIVLGITLLFGKFKKLTVWLLLLIILFFTFLTGFSHFTGKVTDCGCFGDFMKLTPYQSFMKDILLTVLIIIIFIGKKHLVEFVKGSLGNAIVGVLTILSIWFTYSNYFDLPVKDFRAYKIGTNIPDCIAIPEGAPQDKYEITYIYKSKETGEEQDFVNTFPKDFDAWEYVDRKDKLIEKGYEAKCKDFSITDMDGVDVTNDILGASEKMLLITSFNISLSNPKGFERLAAIAAEAEAKGIQVIGITGSTLDDAEALRHELGLTASFYNLDAVPIKTMNRSNPGLVLLEKGTILGKWHHKKAKSLEKVLK